MKRIILLLLTSLSFSSPVLAGSSVTITHGDISEPTYIDLGDPGPSVGDQRIWEFSGVTDKGEAVVMDFIMTTTGRPDPQTGLESRITSAVISIGNDSNDRVLIQGLGRYPKAGSAVKPEGTLERAVIGGTGRFAGARGTVATAHLSDGSWRHVLNLE